MDSDTNRLADSLLSSVQGPESPRLGAGPPSAHANGGSSGAVAYPTSSTGAGPAVSASSAAAAAGPSPRQAQGRMRSSIACSRCRRSKVKCVNNGVGTRCRACETSGRECEYPSAVVGPHRRRDSFTGRPEHLSSSVGGGGGGGDPERRHRPRKSTAHYPAHHGGSSHGGHHGGHHLSVGMRESPRPLLDALDPKLLTATVWLELFDIYETHYSADFPFLHAGTFKKPLHNAKSQSLAYSTLDAAPAVVRPPFSQEFLLSFLALTARFHPKLVAHHSPPVQGRASNPLLASEYYAEAVNERLIPFALGQRKETIETVQSYLMLGLHEWGMCRGWHAWQLVGRAIRAAQALGLQYDADLDDEPLSLSVPPHNAIERPDDDDDDDDVDDLDLLAAESDRKRRGPSTTPVAPATKTTLSPNEDSELFLQQEIRRRTFWSCFILDRYLSSGKLRPQSFKVSDIRVQLPASERKFAFTDRVRTLMLGEAERDGAAPSRRSLAAAPAPSLRGPSPPRGLSRLDAADRNAEIEKGEYEGVGSRYVKITELYGKVLSWACAGGRHTEQHPPWDSRSQFYQLRQQLQEFKATLPREQSLTRNYIQAHSHGRSLAPYMLIHVLFSLCQVFLHREYIPFIPLQCAKPSGPLDEPSFPADKFSVPERFWEDSAAECFAAARDIIDLITTCDGYGQLVQTPIVGFAVYIVAFTGVYCITFPEMDPQGYLCTPVAQRTRDPESAGKSPGFQAAIAAAEMLKKLQGRLHMAEGWYKTLRRLGRFLKKVRDLHVRSTKAVGNGETSGGAANGNGEGNGIKEEASGDEYRVFERNLSDFGNVDQEDVEMTDAHAVSDRRGGGYGDDSDSHDTGDVKSEDEGAGGRSGVPISDQLKTASGGGGGGGAWSAINTPHSNQSSRQPSVSATPQQQGQQSNGGGFRSYGDYGAQQGAQPGQGQGQQSYGFRPAYSADGGSHQENSNNFSAANDRTADMPPPASTAPNGNGHPAATATPQPASSATTKSLSPTESLALLAQLPQSLGADDIAAFTSGASPGTFVVAAASWHAQQQAQLSSSPAALKEVTPLAPVAFSMTPGWLEAAAKLGQEGSGKVGEGSNGREGVVSWLRVMYQPGVWVEAGGW